MALATSGTLTLANIQTEFGGSNPIGLNEYYAGGGLVPSGTSGTYGAVPSTGQITLQNFYGTTAFTPLYVEDVFNVTTYTGNSTARTFNTGLNMTGSGGLVTIKERNGGGNAGVSTPMWNDTVRGAANYLNPSSNAGNSAWAYGLDSFTSTGFGISFGGPVNDPNGNFYAVSWRKAPKFFTIVTYTGTGSARTIAHDLGSVPGCMMIKRTDTSGNNWKVYHKNLTSAAYYLTLNSTSTQTSDSTVWNSTAPTSSVFTVGTNADVNASGASYVAYIWGGGAQGFGATGTEDVLVCGSFSSGTSEIDLGWEPQYILIKNLDYAGNWYEVNNQSGLPYAPMVSEYQALNLNTAAVDMSGSTTINASNKGFKVADMGGNNIYIAVRRGLMKPPTSGTQVYNGTKIDGVAGTKITTNFPIDTQFVRYYDAGNSCYWMDRVRGVSTRYAYNWTNYYAGNSTSGESMNGSLARNWVTSGCEIPSVNAGVGANFGYFSFRRAAGFFDSFTWTWTGSSASWRHNLRATPELVMFKNSRSGGFDWQVWASAVGSQSRLRFNTDAGNDNNINSFFNNTTPTSTTLYTGTESTIAGGTTQVYLFATCPGVSKIGVYTGNAAARTIDCGFTTSARFIMIKRTDTTGDWYIFSTAFGITSGADQYFLHNSASTIDTANNYIDPNSTGFAITSSGAGVAGLNASGGTYLFLAIS